MCVYVVTYESYGNFVLDCCPALNIEKTSVVYQRKSKCMRDKVRVSKGNILVSDRETVPGSAYVQNCVTKLYNIIIKKFHNRKKFDRQ